MYHFSSVLLLRVALSKSLCVCSVIHLWDVINPYIPGQNENDLLYFNSNSSNLDRYVRAFLMGRINMNRYLYGYLIPLLFVFVYIAFVLSIRAIKCTDIYV